MAGRGSGGHRPVRLDRFAHTQISDRATRDHAKRVVERWNAAIAASRDTWWSLTIRAAIVGGTPWFDIYCPGCHTSRQPRPADHRSAPGCLSRQPCPGAAVYVVRRCGGHAVAICATFRAVRRACSGIRPGCAGPFFLPIEKLKPCRPRQAK
jgi:hypothetical protein